MNTKIIAGIVIFVVVIGGVIALVDRAPSASNQEVVATPLEASPAPSQASGTPLVTPVSSAPRAYSLADVAAHSDASSCYTAISGKVYDLTPWISEHPGGQEAILSLCGHDGTDAFMAQHGGQGRPERELANFLLGDLKQ